MSFAVNPSTTLAGQRVVIFGGSSGMGKGTAASVIARGAKVTLVSRDASKLSATAAWLQAPAGMVDTAAVDVQSEDAVAAFFSGFAPGSVNHVVFTIGPSLCGGPIDTIDLSKVHAQLSAKFITAVAVTKHAVPRIPRGGSLVFLSGALSRRPSPGSSILASTNAAIDALARALAVDLAPKGIRSNSVSPGLTNTEIWDGMPVEVRTKMYAGFGAASPTGRVGEIEDIGEAVAYLLTAGWVTGHTLDCDGGQMVGPVTAESSS